MKFVDFLIFFGGLVAMAAVMFVGFMFILQQEIPSGFSVTDERFITSLANIILGAMIILFGGRIFNNSIDAIKLGRKKDA